jgi:hypothetical protein
MPPATPGAPPSTTGLGYPTSTLMTGPVPDPLFMSSSAGSVGNSQTLRYTRSRNAAYDDRLGNFDVAPGSNAAATSPAKKFVPAPSAAAVWNSRAAFQQQ